MIQWQKGRLGMGFLVWHAARWIVHSVPAVFYGVGVDAWTVVNSKAASRTTQRRRDRPHPTASPLIYCRVCGWLLLVARLPRC
ncbi:hypothetical protein B0T19DRAFT_414700 [Cercophora scortea]|uniref:Uncharacterized protein n=1 Tax=Cercophora scortea TaxID=314031 RepID=A0AAE0MGU4_9PEZI|nr:hypothetical protein B0T19DRAFT_414700 [Cercophora scortea]